MTTNKGKSRERDLQRLQQLRVHLFRTAASRKKSKKYRRSQAAFNQQEEAINEEMEIACTTTLLIVIFEEEEEEKEQAEVKKSQRLRREGQIRSERYEAYGSTSFKRAYRQMNYMHVSA